MPSARSEREVYIRGAIHGAAVCLQWQASDATEDGNGYPISEGGDEHTEAVYKLIAKRVGSFIRFNLRELQNAGVPASQAGHDLILTANGHGAGFWDRGLGEAGDRLTQAAKTEGEFDAEFALWGNQADDDLHCSDELAWLMVENEIVFHDDGYQLPGE